MGGQDHGGGSQTPRGAPGVYLLTEGAAAERWSSRPDGSWGAHCPEPVLGRGAGPDPGRGARAVPGRGLELRELQAYNRDWGPE